MPLDAYTLLGQGLLPLAGFSCTSTSPAAAVVASYSPKEMKFHLNKIRGLDRDQALQMCSEDITICTQKPAMSSDSSPIATETCAKILILFHFQQDFQLL